MNRASKFELKHSRRRVWMPRDVIADLPTTDGRITAWRSPRGGATVRRTRTTYTRATPGGRLYLVWLLSESPVAGAPEFGHIGEKILCRVFQVGRYVLSGMAPLIAILTAIVWTLLVQRALCG